MTELANGTTSSYKFHLCNTIESIQNSTDELIKEASTFQDHVAKLNLNDISIFDFCNKINTDDGKYEVKRRYIDFVQHVSTEKDLREASAEADKKLSDFEVETEMRKDLFDQFVVIQKKVESLGSDAGISAEFKRFVDKTVKNGRRNGLDLSAEKQEEVKTIKKRMSELGIDFERNLGEDTTILEFTKAELVGLSDDFINSLDKGKTDDTVILTLKYPHYFPCMKLAKNPETRRKIEFAFNTRCKEKNIGILKELASLRNKKAKILNYSTHADFVLEMRMAKNADTVKDFLVTLAEKLKPLLKSEMDTFLELKKKDCDELGIPFDNKINPYDVSYYSNKVEQLKYSVDHEKLKEYFPIETVTKGLLDIYQQLLGLKFSKVENATVWHKDVTLYSVVDAVNGVTLGYFFLDLYPRDGKYGHAACFDLQPSVVIDGTRQCSVCAMVANFTKPTADKPSLLTHDEVETYFHEFGHVMHNICALTETVMFSGTSVERDFVEAPSQMLENWCWTKPSLSLMSGHYKTGEPIPADLLDALINSRNANAGYFNLRQITLATYDQTIHTTDGDVDIVDEFYRVCERFVGITPSPGTAFPANFGHLAGGYDAQYYGYMWSEVFSADMFATRFGSEGVLSPKAGMDYRKCILEPGGSHDALEMLKAFLGREPNQEAFLKMKGL